MTISVEKWREATIYSYYRTINEVYLMSWRPQTSLLLCNLNAEKL